MFVRKAPLAASPSPRLARRAGLLVGLVVLASAGCGATQQSTATKQLLESDAVDAAVSQVDFSPLAGRKVFFDTTYIVDYKGIGFVNANYVVSGLRQQILSAGCELQESKDKADVIIEGRVGTLGSDEHDLVYGIPKNNAINSVASAVPGSPNLPAIPELALAKKVSSQGAAKLALFAYDRESRKPVWQSGLAVARSSAQDTWLLGAGPFQNGTIHRNKVRFAGRRLSWRFWSQPEGLNRGEHFAAYEHGAVFQEPSTAPPPTLIAGPATVEPQKMPTDAVATPIPAMQTPEIQQVSNESPAAESPAKPEPSPPAKATPDQVPTPPRNTEPPLAANGDAPQPAAAPQPFPADPLPTVETSPILR